MCGIVGVLGSKTNLLPSSSVLELMTDRLTHRGPDRGDLWENPSQNVALGHRRLSIVDLSSCGDQPIFSNDGRLVLTFNGEIYNHLNLRASLQLEGHEISWRGHSDSETLVECLSAWGVEKTLKKIVGMFAFGLWDTEYRTLTLARDRFGEKPLYYGFVNGLFGFASELKALRPLTDKPLTIDRTAVALFMRYGYVPTPRSIYEEVRKLAPGTWLKVDGSMSAIAELPIPSPYWSLTEVATYGQTQQLTELNDKTAVDALENVLTEAIGSQMMSDVPIGAFLSGGIDSSLVVSIMQKISAAPVKTFSIGFSDDQFNEAQFARAVAQHLGTDHSELYVSSAEALAVIPSLPEIYDEPFADSSQIPTYLVSALAREKVAVSLSGDGGDEIFGGYNRYFIGAKRWPSLERIPLVVRRFLANGVLTISPKLMDSVLKSLHPATPRAPRMALPEDKIHKAARAIKANSSREMYETLVSLPAVGLVVGVDDNEIDGDLSWPIRADLEHQMMALDSISFLPGDILTKVDRAAMANSLETRIPFLDRRVAEFAWQLPRHFKFREGKGKWILREALYQSVPRHLIDRPKMGFGVPLAEWLRGPLRDWASSLLETEKIKTQGILDPDLVAKKWQEHLSGHRNRQHLIWHILMFQAWLEKHH